MTNSSVFTEDSRVKIPTILHLIQLGYEYLSLKEVKWDLETNIFPDIFRKAIAGLNPEINSGDSDNAFKDLSKAVQLDSMNAEAHDDLGVVFAQKGEFSKALKH